MLRTWHALSCVTSLSGLHLIDFQKSRIQCDKAALTEYNILRQLYTPQLGQLPIPTVSRKRTKQYTQEDAETPTATQERCKQRTKDAETIPVLETCHTLLETTDNLPPNADATSSTLVVNNRALTSIFQHCAFFSFFF